MFSKEFLSAVTALSLASGVAAVGCSDPTATIASQADATQVAGCETVKGSVLIDTAAGPDIDLSGDLTEIGGDLICLNNGNLQSLSSSSLQTIGGAFNLQNVTQLNSLSFTSLNKVDTINWLTLNALPEPTFGDTGITEASSVTISDTFIETITGINVQTVSTMEINNNRRLTMFTSSIESLSDQLIVQANGLNLSMDLPNVKWIANMQIANVTSFSVPSLETVNGSMRFDSNYFENFQVANLTTIQNGDLSFVSCPDVTNISFPVLTKVGGGFTIANNTALSIVDGFDQLANVGGAIEMRGVFTEIELPELNNVVGTATFISTDNITSSCSDLESLSGSVIQGKITTCHGEDSAANNATSGSDGNGSSSGSGNGSSGAALVGASLPTIVSLAAVGAIMTAFL
ncbi:hypothetical protein GGR56DRAFT_141529 [Xylariaceae sp. FL0804]|nr:hypothetical protein GGR56DRAFT_141529 [Xylariaceae sp. FL0804]